MRILAGATALLLISGCAMWIGPADGSLFVVGSTPGPEPCELSVAPVGASFEPTPRVVSSEFRERFMVHPSHKGHRVQLSCNDVVVSSRTFKYGRDVNFGGDLPLAGSAP